MVLSIACDPSPAPDVVHFTGAGTEQRERVPTPAGTPARTYKFRPHWGRGMGP